ncbi:MAG: C4-dicarboxylate ABC transporter, partial [Marinovum sp.]|nr:C4-dicarboxylate ABC transporter [Marinovum sp.]
IATLGQTETDEIKALGEAVIQEWIADANAKGLDGQLLVDDARSAVAGTLN